MNFLLNFGLYPFCTIIAWSLRTLVKINLFVNFGFGSYYNYAVPIYAAGIVYTLVFLVHAKQLFQYENLLKERDQSFAGRLTLTDSGSGEDSQTPSKSTHTHSTGTHTTNFGASKNWRHFLSMLSAIDNTQPSMPSQLSTSSPSSDLDFDSSLDSESIDLGSSLHLPAERQTFLLHLSRVGGTGLDYLVAAVSEGANLLLEPSSSNNNNPPLLHPRPRSSKFQQGRPSSQMTRMRSKSQPEIQLKPSLTPSDLSPSPFSSRGPSETTNQNLDPQSLNY